MSTKSKKAKINRKDKVKSKNSKGSKSLSKIDSKKAFDPVEREAARSKALEARLYFQRADLGKKEIELQQAHELQIQAEEVLKNLTENTAEVSAFTTWQHEHTVERLTNRINILTITNTKLRDEKNYLQSKLEASMEELTANLAAKESEILKLNKLIKESHYKYERVFALFADRLVEKLTENWENEKPFLKELEDRSLKQFLQNGFLCTFDI